MESCMVESETQMEDLFNILCRDPIAGEGGRIDM